MKHFYIFLLAKLMLSQAFAAEDIFVIQHSRNYLEAAQRDGVDVKAALERDIGNSKRFYIIIARRNDCWTNQVSSAMQRSMVIRSAANVIVEASNSPTYFPVDRCVAQIKQQILSASQGLEIPRTHYLAPPNAAPESPERNSLQLRGSSIGINEPVEKIEDTPRKTNLRQIIVDTLLISLLIFGATYVVIRIARKKRQRQELQHSKVESLRQRVASKETEIRSKFPELQSQFHLNVLIIAATLLFISNSFAQGSYDLRLLDGSGTYRSKLVEAKKEIAISILSGRPAHIVVFGDSIRTIGEVRTIAQLDSVFVNLGKDKTTKLSDAISWLVSYTDSLRRQGFRPSVTVYSDFWNDDDGNEALSKGLIASREASDSLLPDTSRGPIERPTSGNESLAEGFFYGLSVSIVLMIVAWVGFLKRRRVSTQHYKILEILTGNQARQFSVSQLRNRKLKIAPSFDADVRSGSSELSVETAQENGSLSISMQPSKDNNEIITLTLKQENGHER